MFYTILVALVFLLDRGSKLWVQHVLWPGESVQVIRGVISLTYIHNPGAAFGLFAHQTAFFIGVSILVVAGTTGYYLYRKTLPRAQQVALALICGGALGNLWDRMHYGEVIDFLHLAFWPVFNLADVAIVSGTGLLVLLIWRAGEQEGR